MSESLSDSIEYDIVIIGGGMIGASMALALSPLPLRIAIIDAVKFDHQLQPSFDDRSIALSQGSKIILDTIGIWSDMKEQTAAIEHIHVSDKGHMGMCRLHAKDYGQNALGYVVENRVAGHVFYRSLERCSNIDIFAPTQITHITQMDFSARIEINHQNTTQLLNTRLLIAADGTHSPTAKMLGVEQETMDYSQVALTCNLEVSHHSPGWAFERFTDTGPLALLPLTQRRLSLVWSLNPAQQEEFTQLSDNAFKQRLQKQFGFRVGKIERVGRRVIYPLRLRKLKQGHSGRTVFIGNALHTGHPVAGQGFNLGLRDVAQMAEIVAKAMYEKRDVGSLESLNEFWEKRQQDIEDTLGITDALAHLFSNQNAVLGLVRNLTLKWLDVIHPAKQAFAFRAMGQRRDLPALARGVSLLDLPRYTITSDPQ